MNWREYDIIEIFEQASPYSFGKEITKLVFAAIPTNLSTPAFHTSSI
jgi:hypothetical protein